MAIETHKDPKTRKEYTLVTGKVEGVYINALKTLKTYDGPNGPWTPTHSINLIVDGTRISLGLTDKEVVRAKDVDDEYQDVEKGAEVSVVVTEGDEYKGVKQYNSRTSQVTVIEVAAKSASQPQAGGKPAYTGKKDMSGISTGHALNGAMNFLGNDYEDVAELVKTAKAIHDITEKVKASYKAANPDLSDYDTGAAAGNAILNACKVVVELKDIEEVANQILAEVVPEITAYVKASTTKEEPKKVTKPAAKKTPVKKTAVKKAEAEAAKEAEQAEESENPSAGVEDSDDDIPF